VNRPGDEVTVRKLDPIGGEKWRWRAVVRQVSATSIVVEARYNAGDADRFGLEFRGGDRLLESYFADRWYNVFALFAANTGVFKGWYCNVSRPAQWMDSEIQWVDLELDIVVRPDGHSAVLDEDEFSALVISEDERVAARAAVDELVRHAHERTGPFASAEPGEPAQA
jgi:hypothetical protein